MSNNSKKRNIIINQSCPSHIVQCNSRDEQPSQTVEPILVSGNVSYEPSLPGFQATRIPAWICHCVFRNGTFDETLGMACLTLIVVHEWLVKPTWSVTQNVIIYQWGGQVSDNNTAPIIQISTISTWKIYFSFLNLKFMFEHDTPEFQRKLVSFIYCHLRESWLINVNFHPRYFWFFPKFAQFILVFPVTTNILMDNVWTNPVFLSICCP